MSGVLCDKRIPQRVKGKIYKMVVQPAMLYATETLPLASRHVRKLETTEMKMCRWTCGHTRKDHGRNDDIRSRLEVENISVLCKKARLRWFGQVKRKDQNFVGRYTLEMKPPGKRRRRPNTSMQINPSYVNYYSYVYNLSGMNQISITVIMNVQYQIRMSCCVLD